MSVLLSIAQDAPVGALLRPGALGSRLKRRLTTAALFVVTLQGLSPSVWALNINPGWTEVWASPGEVVKVSIRAQNDTPNRLMVELSEKEGIGTQTGGGLTVDKWMKLEAPLSFTLDPGQTHEVNVTATCPKEPTNAQLTGTVSMRYRTETPSNMVPMISVPVYVFIKGLASASAVIDHIDIVNAQGYIGLGATVKNTGNIHLRMHGGGEIRTSKGQVIQSFSIPQTIPVFAKSERSYGARMDWPAALVPGRYLAHLELGEGEVRLSGDQTFTVKKDKQIVLDKVK